MCKTCNNYQIIVRNAIECMNTVDIVLDYIEIGKKKLSFVCEKCQKR